MVPRLRTWGSPIWRGGLREQRAASVDDRASRRSGRSVRAAPMATSPPSLADVAEARHPPDVDQRPRLARGEASSAAAGCARRRAAWRSSPSSRSSSSASSTRRRSVVVERAGIMPLLPPLAAWIARQTFSGVERHVDVLHAERAQRVETALTTAGVEPIVPASPTPLTPSGFTGVGVTVLVELEVGSIVGPRHGVVHQRAGEELAVLVVDAPPRAAPGRCPGRCRRGPGRRRSSG